MSKKTPIEKQIHEATGKWVSRGANSIPTRLKHAGYESYAEYLRSDHWRDVKKRYRESKLKKCCCVCGEKKYDLHHKSYKTLGQESLNHVIPLCRKHHEETHKAINPKKGLWFAVKKIKKEFWKEQRRFQNKRQPTKDTANAKHRRRQVKKRKRLDEKLFAEQNKIDRILKQGTYTDQKQTSKQAHPV